MRSGHHALGIALCVAAWLAPLPRTAHADPATEARFLDGVARREYAARRWDAALDAFLAAHRAAPSPRLLYNIALCAQLSGRAAMAFTYFDDYLRGSDDDAARREDARTRQASLRGGLALVTVTSDPPGATIYAEPRDLGVLGHAPDTVVLEPGAHRLVLALADHEEATLDVQAVRGETRTATATLAARTGTLTLSVTPVEATVVARRGDAEQALIAGANTLPSGRYTLVARAPGHRPLERELRVQAGEDARDTLTLEPLPEPRGTLLVSLGAPIAHARVRVDGADVAEAPVRVDTLRPGTHRVEVRAAGHTPWTGRVHITENAATHLTVDLIRTR